MSSLFEQTLAEYPMLRDTDVLYKESHGARPGFLEFWPPTEPGSPEAPRPKEFPMGKAGVEIYDPKTRPIDLLGDIVSHHLVETDPILKTFYQQFEHSLTPRQRETLQKQYVYAKENFGEKRPYADWEKHSGLPGYFRGYAFDQWKDSERWYEPEQLKMFDQMMSYLRRNPMEDVLYNRGVD